MIGTLDQSDWLATALIGPLIPLSLDHTPHHNMFAPCERPALETGKPSTQKPGIHFHVHWFIYHELKSNVVDESVGVLLLLVLSQQSSSSWGSIIAQAHQATYHERTTP